MLQNSAKRSLSSQTKLQHDLRTTAEQVSGYRRQVADLEKIRERQNRCIATVEAERDHYLGEAQDLAKRVDLLLDEMSDADGAVFTFKKELGEMESRLKQQQNKYEAARNDRGMLSKNLTAAQDEIADLRGKLRVFQHQFDQLKEEMVAKEAALVKAGQDQQKLVKEKEDLALEVDSSREETKQIGRKSKEVEKSLSLVQDRHRQQQGELDKCRARLEEALRKRSLCDARLAKSEAELAQLRKREAVQERVLARGEGAYQERVEDIRVLKLEVKRLAHEAAVSARSVRATDDLKQEVLQLQKDLLAERARARSLQSEVESPLNVHRWRKLQGNDPSSFELVQKVQALQRKLIARKEDIVERDLALLVKEKTNGELRTALARQQPGTAAEDEVRGLKAELRVAVQQTLVAFWDFFALLNEEWNYRSKNGPKGSQKPPKLEAHAYILFKWYSEGRFSVRKSPIELPPRAGEEARKSAAAENNLLRTQVSDATRKLERMAEECHEAKRKLAAANKRAQRLKELQEKPAAAAAAVEPRQNAPVPRRNSSGTPRKFAGGGFRLTFDED